MTEKLFTFCGISDLKGQYKVRFANDEKRVTVLIKGDHYDVRLIQLPEPMTKLNAAQFILTAADFDDDIAQATISDFITTESAKALPKVKVAKQTPVTKVIATEEVIDEDTVIEEDITDNIADLEHEPF
jgi:hypothetical protein